VVCVSQVFDETLSWNLSVASRTREWSLNIRRVSLTFINCHVGISHLAVASLRINAS
jgi:hypothetical protein